MENPISVLTLMPSTNKEVAYFSQSIITQLINGSLDFKQLLYQKKFIEETLEAIFENEDVKKHIEGEIEKYGKEGVGFHDAKFELSTRKTFDYSQTNDSEIINLEGKLKEATNNLKDRQKFLQTLTKPLELFNNETGEVEMIYPAVFSTSTFVKTTFSKK